MFSINRGMKCVWLALVCALAGIVPCPQAAIAAAPTPPSRDTAPPPVATPALLGQLSLPAAQALMADGNRQVRLAQRALDAASADIRRADVGPNPTVSTSVSNTLAHQYRVRDTDRVLRVEQTLERGSKRTLRIAVAQAGEIAARFDLADVARQQRIVLAQAYFDLLAAQRSVLIADENAAGYARLLDAAQRRLSAGDLASVDVARLSVERSRADNDARTARAAIEQNRVALAVVLGREADARHLRAADDFPTVPSDGVSDASRASAALLEQVIARRADAAAARARLTALERARELAVSQRTRDLSIGVQTESAPGFGGNVFGISASFPLFLNNDYSGDIARAQADIDQAAEELARVRGAIQADIDRTASQLAAALERVARFQASALPQARQASEAIEFAFTRGAATLTDLFDARRQFAAVRADAILAQAEYARAAAAWREAIALEETP